MVFFNYARPSPFIADASQYLILLNKVQAITYGLVIILFYLSSILLPTINIIVSELAFAKIYSYQIDKDLNDS